MSDSDSQRLSPFYLLLPVVEEDKALEKLHVIMLRNRVSVTTQNGFSKKEHIAA